MKVLVTGGRGLLGKALVKYLESKNYIVYSKYFDVSNYKSTAEVIKSIRPDYFINTAGISSIPDNTIEKAFRVNTQAVNYQLDAIHKYCKSCRYLNCGSTNEFYSTSLYSLSKAQARQAVEYYVNKGIHAIQPYYCNFTSINQSNKFILPKLIRAIKHKDFPIQIGNTKSVRAFMYIDDVVSATWFLINLERPNNVILNGEISSIDNIIKKIENLCGYKAEFETDFALWRETEHANFYYSSCVDMTSLGWKPSKNLDEIIKILYTYL